MSFLRPCLGAALVLACVGACTVATTPAASPSASPKAKVVGASPTASPAAKTPLPTASNVAGTWLPATFEAEPGPVAGDACRSGNSPDLVRLVQDGSRVTYAFSRRYSGGAQPPASMVTDLTETAAGELVEGAIAFTGESIAISREAGEVKAALAFTLRFEASSGHLVGEKDKGPFRLVPVVTEPRGATPCPAITPAP